MKLDEIELRGFEKMFYSWKQNKLFIQLTNRSNLSYWHRVLVSDMKNDYFYFVEKSFPSFCPSALIINLRYLNFTQCKDGTVYATCQYRKIVSADFEITTEIRAFQIRNDKLVNDRVKWRKLNRIDSQISSLTSACFV